MTVPFVLRMAVRETRSAWRRLLFFFICIAVGVAAIVALRSVIQNVRAVFNSEARSLTAADVLIATSRDWTPETRAVVDRRLTAAVVCVACGTETEIPGRALATALELVGELTGFGNATVTVHGRCPTCAARPPAPR